MVTTVRDTTIERKTYTANETALILGVHPVTVKRWTANGQIPSFKVGHARRIRRDVVEALMNPACPVQPRANEWTTAEEFIALMRPAKQTTA